MFPHAHLQGQLACREGYAGLQRAEGRMLPNRLLC